MTTSVRTRGQVRATHDDCGCGCGGKGRCCGLECLTRPNFYCGQLLTDADLSATVQWVRDRLGLVRYRDGWGVVCGLEVTCQAPERPQSCCSDVSAGPYVWIGPGYAVDCCGNDLVICEPLRVDLTEICRPSDDPCGDPCSPPPHDRESPAPSAGKMRKVVGEWQLSRDELIQVDVSLRFGEEPESGQRSMFQSGCSNGGACEYARVRERPVPALRIVEEGNDRQPDNSESSEARAKAAYARIEELVAGTPKEILQRLRQYPIYTACFITDFVRAQEDSETEKWRERLTQALLYDWIQHDAVCRCSTCRTDQGVPIARVTLWRKFGRSDCCRVLLIQNNPPFRRPIQSDCQPLVADKVSIRHLVGQPLEGVRRYLTHDNITLEEPAASSSPSELRPRLDAEIGRSVRPETIDLLGSRYFLGIRNG